MKMGDAAKQVRSKGKMEEDDFSRSPVKPYSGHEFYGKKVERDSQKPKPIAITNSSHPHNGPPQNTVKNFSPSGRECSNYKDSMKQEQRSNCDNWRERRQQTYNRSRNNSTNEPGDGSWWPDGGERRNVMGRRQNHKDAAADFHDSLKHGKTKHERPRRQSERNEDECLESPIVDESVLSKKELLGLQQAEERLKRDCIYRLKRRPRKHPTATYTCKLCETLVDSIASAHKHIKDKRHRRNLKEKREEELLTTLPPPTLPQIQAIDVAISKIVQEHGLDEDDLLKRQSILSAMENLIKERLPGCSLRLYGSSSSRMGFRNSDLNIDIQFPANMLQPDVLLLVQESLKQSDLFTDFDTDFHARVPVVVCREKQSGLLCKVSAGNENACLTTNLLATLGRLESRLLPLVVTFRYWAKLCGVDKPEEGGLPQYVAALMVVFFLQQRKEPILPVYLGSWIEGFTISKLEQFSLQETENDYIHWEYKTAGDNENVQTNGSTKGKTPLIYGAEKQNPVSVGQLWVDLLRFYALEFDMADLVISIRVKENISRELKDWPKKRIAVEDPYSAKRNVARSMNSQLVYEYMLHCLKATYKYFAMPQNKSGKSTRKPAGSKTAENECVQTVNSVNEPHVMPVENLSRNLGNLTIDNYDGTSVDSVIGHRELESIVKKQLVFESYPDAAPENADGVQEDIPGDPEDSLQSCEEPESPHEESDDDHSFREEDSESGEAPVAGNETDSLSDFEGGVVAKGEDFVLGGRGKYVVKDDLDQGSTEGTDELEETLHEYTTDFDVAAINSADDEDYDEENSLILIHRPHLDSLVADEELEDCIGSVDDMLSEDDALSDHLKDLKASLDISDPEYLQADVLEKLSLDNCLFYEFSKPTFTKGKLPTVVCYLCKKEGHLKRDCPEDFKRIELETLPPLTSKFIQILDEVCMQCYEDFSPTTLEDKAREHIRQDLEEFIRREFQGARLSLFGSSKNGFGFKQSDLDICMTFDGLETAEELDSIWTIEELARHLRKHQGLRNILPITTAKVPIVKFYHVRSGLEGDISLYNTLALHNTHLLASYAAVDPRVKYLCYIMKVFTKICDIGDASRGSLSSYAYTLLVLYFLQQRNPPVIPVLQEIYTDNNKPEILVDGWNVYFFANLEQLEKYWPDYGKNKESVGELWLGLLRFYTEEFDFKEHVISIRRKSLLTTFKKQWTSKYIVIEDPFDLNHNLGAGLSRKMTNFIMKAFINGRRVFGTPLKGFPKEYPSKMEYFFDPDVLTEGEVAPNDRCCRICGKIGHFMKDCPMRRKVRRRNNDYAANQRYPEKRQQRKTEDKDVNRSTEGEALGKDGKPLYSTPKKTWQGARSPHDVCKERTPRHSNDRWKRHDDRELREKRCFICGREGHVKKECPQYMGTTGSPKTDVFCGSPSASSPQKQQGRFIQVIPSQDGKKKQMSFSPQSGSLSSKYMSQGKGSQKRAQVES